MGFWEKLKRPFFALAPMADVTDAAFRRMFAKYGKFTRPDGTDGRGPDVLWTEFVSADGLFLAPESDQDPIFLPDDLRETAVSHGIAPNNPLLKDLVFTEDERPIVAQFFSKDPERMRRAAELAVDLGFDGVDINMGCPAKIIVNQGAGCGMIKMPALAQEIIEATKDGAADRIPVTVKTRIGFSENELETWLPTLLATDVPVVTMHARTRDDMSDVPAKWETIAQAVRIRDEIQPKTLIVGNGDVQSVAEGRKKAKEYGCDGIMVGRGAFGNPWFFNPTVKRDDLPLETRFSVMLEHTRLFVELLGDTKPFHVMRKHFKAYAKGFPHAKHLRTELMKTESVAAAEQVVDSFLDS